MPVEFDGESAASRVLDEPDVWTDRRLVLDKVSGSCSSGSVCFSYLLGLEGGGVI